jgi:hypothetical protein
MAAAQSLTEGLGFLFSASSLFMLFPVNYHPQLKVCYGLLINAFVTFRLNDGMNDLTIIMLCKFIFYLVYCQEGTKAISIMSRLFVSLPVFVP